MIPKKDNRPDGPRFTHKGPSKYRAANQAKAPKKGKKGPLAERFSKGKANPASNEAPDKGAKKRTGRGYGKIATTGQPRFTRFSKF